MKELTENSPGHAMPSEQSEFKVALSCIGTFHSFDMARQLDMRGALARIYSGYPKRRLANRFSDSRKIRSFPWLHGPYMANWIPASFRTEWEYWDRISFDAFVACCFPDCDILCALSGSGLRSGRAAQSRGIRYVCDRGSSHIRFQDTILREEYARCALPYSGIDPRVVAREEEEYELADLIFVPSSFVMETFLKEGVPRDKLRLAPYGVDLGLFHPTATPSPDSFDLLFVGGLSVRKGADYLFRAYERLRVSRKTLTIVGVVSDEIKPALSRFTERNPGIELTGHVSQSRLKDIMSRSHALVLPSIEEGLALVQAQALACGCPVVASRNTGSEDLFTDRVEGRIVPPRDVDALVSAVQELADDPELRRKMSAAALENVRKLGGWNQYGQIVMGHFRGLLAAPGSLPSPRQS